MFSWKIVVGIVGGRPDPQWVGDGAAGRAAPQNASNPKAANSPGVPGGRSQPPFSNRQAHSKSHNVNNLNELDSFFFFLCNGASPQLCKQVCIFVFLSNRGGRLGLQTCRMCRAFLSGAASSACWGFAATALEISPALLTRPNWGCTLPPPCSHFIGQTRPR